MSLGSLKQAGKRSSAHEITSSRQVKQLLVTQQTQVASRRKLPTLLALRCCSCSPAGRLQRSAGQKRWESLPDRSSRHRLSAFRTPNQLKDDALRAPRGSCSLPAGQLDYTMSHQRAKYTRPDFASMQASTPQRRRNCQHQGSQQSWAQRGGRGLAFQRTIRPLQDPGGLPGLVRLQLVYARCQRLQAAQGHGAQADPPVCSSQQPERPLMV